MNTQIRDIGQPSYQTIQGKFNTYIGEYSNVFSNIIFSNFTYNDNNYSGRSYETHFDYNGKLGIFGIGWDYFGDRFLHKALVSVQGRIGLNKEVLMWYDMYKYKTFLTYLSRSLFFCGVIVF